MQNSQYIKKIRAEHVRWDKVPAYTWIELSCLVTNNSSYWISADLPWTYRKSMSRIPAHMFAGPKEKSLTWVCMCFLIMQGITKTLGHWSEQQLEVVARNPQLHGYWNGNDLCGSDIGHSSTIHKKYCNENTYGIMLHNHQQQTLWYYNYLLIKCQKVRGECIRYHLMQI